MAQDEVGTPQAQEWAAGRELLQSVALLGLLLAPMGSLVGLGLLAVRVFAG